MFVTVKFGDNQSEIFNANCRNRHLLHNIKARCNPDGDALLELSDENGVVKNLHKHPQDYGTQFVQSRECLILLKVDKRQPDQEILYVPLLSGKEEDKDFIARLNPKPSSKSNKSRRDHQNGHVDEHDVIKSPNRSSSRRNSLVGARRSSISGRRGSRGTLSKK